MNTKELKAELELLGVSPLLYSLRGRSDEKLCLECRDGDWYVYFVERGRERPMRAFDSEGPACEFMLGLLKVKA